MHELWEVRGGDCRGSVDQAVKQVTRRHVPVKISIRDRGAVSYGPGLSGLVDLHRDSGWAKKI